MPDAIVPIRRPAQWTAAEHLRLLKNGPFNCLIDAGPLAGAAKDLGLMTLESARPPEDVSWVKTAKWPRVLGGRRSGGDDADGARAAAAAGPTGTPWVDSNGWLVRLNAHLHPGRTVWLADEPRTEVAPLAYPLAVADAAYAGGRWVVSLDSKLAAGLVQGEAKAAETWSLLVKAVRFFHDWRVTGAEPAAIGVYSDFEGSNEAIAGEVLNLMGRRHLPARIVTPSTLAKDARELQMMVVVDRAGKLPAPPLPAGRILAVAPGMEDPYAIAAEAHLRLGRKYDVIRTWNAGTTNVRYTESANGKSALFQIVNYAMRPAGHEMSVWMRGPWTKAKWLSIGSGETPAPVQVERKNNGLEAALPPLEVYGVLQVEV